MYSFINLETRQQSILMASKIFSFLLAFIILTGSSYAERTVIKKDIAFIVRTPDVVKHIAIRFHVPVRTLIRINPLLRKRQTLYAGKRLVIPVWLQKKDPGRPAAEYNVADYTIDIDSLDAYIREDFICMADIESDTLRQMAIEKEIKQINKNIYSLDQAIDSVTGQGMRTLSKSDIRKMQMARERHTGDFSFATQIDTLVQKREKLNEEKTKIELRRADYDYLLENASYAATHTDDDKSVIHLQDWGDDPNKGAKAAKK
jgi:hypothetical protein